jgi:undecaprenyl diphosphate synthase
VPQVPVLANVPLHIGVIMDGNGRWAQHRGLPRLAGHREGATNIRRVLEACVDHGVQVLTVYAFSTENWGRPRDEVEGLLEILDESIARETPSLFENGVRVCHVGRTEDMPPDLVGGIRRAVDLTKHNQRITLNVAFNYGGRAEIIDALRKIVQAGIPEDQIDEETFGRFLYTAGQPDPDLIIRTAGEMRLSNFLIWQAAYAEYYATPTFWPDFGKEQLTEALVAYNQRQRRFGKVSV